MLGLGSLRRTLGTGSVRRAALAALAGLCFASDAGIAAETADTVLFNGKILTVDSGLFGPGGAGDRARPGARIGHLGWR